MGLSELSKVAPVREAGGRPDGAWGGARPHFLAHIWQRLSLARANTCKRLNSVLLLTLAIKHMTTLPCSHMIGFSVAVLLPNTCSLVARLP